MKKLIAVICACLTLLVVFAACGENSNVKVEDISAKLVENVDFSDELLELQEGVVFNCYDIDEKKVSAYSIYVSATSSTAEEVAVFKAKSKADVDYIKDKLIATRQQDQTFTYETYVPEEVFKIKNAAIYDRGLYVVMVIAADTSAVENTFESFF